MAFTLPDNDEAFNNNQSIWMQTDINALIAAINGDGVLFGCAVSEDGGGASMDLDITSGTIQINDTSYSITGSAAAVTVTAADGSNPRIDLVTAKNDDTLNMTDGTAAASPKAPDIPANSVLLAMVYVPANDTTIADNQITDKRVIVPGQSGLSVAEGRITLTTGVPITTSDVTAATTVYYTPFNGNRIALYDGSSWITLVFSELSLSLSGWTADKNYDIFLYDNSGTLTLEETVWTNDTTRATALVLQDGVYVKTGALTRRYLGTIRTTVVTGQCEDSRSKRYCWNAYNRTARLMRVQEATDTWVYGTTTWRAARGQSSNRVEYLCGLSEDLVMAKVQHSAVTGGSTGVPATGIGVDSTAVNSADLFGEFIDGSAAATVRSSIFATYMGYPGVGYHYLQWLEYTRTATNVTFCGDLGTDSVQSGMLAVIPG